MFCCSWQLCFSALSSGVDLVVLFYRCDFCWLSATAVLLRLLEYSSTALPPFYCLILIFNIVLSLIRCQHTAAAAESSSTATAAAADGGSSGLPHT